MHSIICILTLNTNNIIVETKNLKKLEYVYFTEYIVTNILI